MCRLFEEKGNALIILCYINRLIETDMHFISSTLEYTFGVDCYDIYDQIC